VCAHAYTVEAITRAAHAGVRTIEHGNLIDEASAKLMAEKGMFLVANLVTYYEMKKRAAEFGMSADMLAKNDLVIEGGLRSLEICKRAGVPVAYGTDLLGQLQTNNRASSLSDRGPNRLRSSGRQRWWGPRSCAKSTSSAASSQVPSLISWLSTATR
jgi:imidazolonepropionase-like amidohydrolase